ncbi:MAG: extracellular solute-binding protein, partial [Chloroflexota bacterium]
MMKIKPVIIISFLLVWMLTACSSDPVPVPELPSSATPEMIIVPTSTPTPEPTPTTAVSQLDIAPADLKNVKIEFWHPWNFERRAALLALIEEFNHQNLWGITVSEQSHGSDLGHIIRDGILSNVLPNLTVGYSSQLNTWERRGDRIVDLNTYVNDPEWGFSLEEQADFLPAFMGDDLVDGKRIGFPANRSAMTLFYNQSWAEDLGFSEPPSTPEDFEEQACATAQHSDHATGWLASLDSTSALGWLYAFGSQVVTEDGYHLSPHQNEETLAFIKDLFADGCAAFPETGSAHQAFAARQGLFLSSSLAGLPAQTAAFQEAGVRDVWLVLPFPAVDGDPVLVTYGLSYVLFKGSPEEQLAAWLFIRWMNQPAQQSEWLMTDSSFSTRASTIQSMDNFINEIPAWGQAQALVVYGRSEPSFASWSAARWAVEDAFENLL